ncbi:hypothetical protein DBR32_12895 [Taibaiella sp. KBW10]|uniref:FtsQ-type POTRA domain-containing protein n=1 Tax=Taibaiella sp. KBW10 TaxID=2153357 RepID=UPI000F5A5572|nr:FtsQ-type POTRA domain-containing protein [Taibaiella sp. KBW10]RQO30456.1 hypothetical protein DBR32_12895 [Taibaiella sp. KBW10]
MSAGKKISYRKVKRFIAATLLLGAFSFILFAATKKQSEGKILGVKVTLKNQGEEENFLLAKDVEQLFVTNNHIDILNKSIATLDLNNIEKLAETNPWVKKAEVYVDNNNKLNIEVTQRLPVARVFTAQGQSFYMDTAGFEMPLSERYAYPVAVFTNVIKPVNDSLYNDLKRKMVYLSYILKADTFWNDQVTQVEVSNDGRFNFYTTIGKQKILFGDTTNAHSKLNNLYSFYREVSNKIGWNKYQTLDVRFKDQVVASPSIGWTPPKDTNIVVLQKQAAATIAVQEDNETPAAAKPAVVTAKTAAPKEVNKKKPEAPVTVKKPEPKPKASTKKEDPKPVKKAADAQPKYQYTNGKNKTTTKK